MADKPVHDDVVTRDVPVCYAQTEEFTFAYKDGEQIIVQAESEASAKRFANRARGGWVMGYAT